MKKKSKIDFSLALVLSSVVLLIAIMVSLFSTYYAIRTFGSISKANFEQIKEIVNELKNKEDIDKSKVEYVYVRALNAKNEKIEIPAGQIDTTGQLRNRTILSKIYPDMYFAIGRYSPSMGFKNDFGCVFAFNTLKRARRTAINLTSDSVYGSYTDKYDGDSLFEIWHDGKKLESHGWLK